MPISASSGGTSRAANTRTPSGSSTYPTVNGANPAAGGTYGGDLGAYRCTVQVHSVPVPDRTTGSAGPPQRGHTGPAG
jgi:hypothetical protein